MTERVMLDIETLGRVPGCAVLSIGAVQFSLSDGLGDEFYRTIDAESCDEAGLEIEGQTVQWWFEQDPEAQNELIGGGELPDVLSSFSSFISSADEIWAKSPAFDVAILEAAYRSLSRDPPWEFWMTRDCRTLMNLPQSTTLPDVGHLPNHHALADAKQQARDIAATLRKVRADA